MGKTFRMEKLVKQTAARLEEAQAALSRSPALNCVNTAKEDIADDFTHATIEALRAYAVELRTYAVGLRQHLDVVRQMNNADVKIEAWDNRLQTLLAEFQDTSRLLSELQRRTDSIVSNLSNVSVPKNAPDDCVLIFARIDFDLIESTADYAEYHADNFTILYPYFGCDQITTAPGGFTEEDRTTLNSVNVGVDELVNNRRAAKDKQRANGYKQASHIRAYNAENESEEKKQDLNEAVCLDKKKYPDAATKRSYGYWKELLKLAPSYKTADALRKAVMRKRNDPRGQYVRTGKKRGSYKKK